MCTLDLSKKIKKYEMILLRQTDLCVTAHQTFHMIMNKARLNMIIVIKVNQKNILLSMTTTQSTLLPTIITSSAIRQS